MLVQRKSKPLHSVGVSVLVPHSRFTPTPTMKPLEIAYFKGLEARRLGRPAADNPHTDALLPNDGALAAEWMRGYGK